MRCRSCVTKCLCSQMAWITIYGAKTGVAKLDGTLDFPQADSPSSGNAVRGRYHNAPTADLVGVKR